MLFFSYLVSVKFLTTLKQLFSINDTETMPVAWSLGIAYKEKVTIDDVKFIFEQAEKVLKNSVATSDIIVNRTNILITIISGSLVAFIGYVITRLSKEFSLDCMLFATCTGIVYLYILVWHCFENTKPKSYFIPGSLPKDLFSEGFFHPSLEDNKRIIHFYVSEIENYQFRIESNNLINKIRWKRYQLLLRGILLLPVVLICCYLFT